MGWGCTLVLLRSGVVLLWGAAAALLAGLLERAGGCGLCILVDTHVPLGLGKPAAPSSPAPTFAVCPPFLHCTEREIKYKQEKKYWEEQQKEMAARVTALAAERDALRGGSGAQQLEERIQASHCCLAWSLVLL